MTWELLWRGLQWFWGHQKPKALVSLADERYPGHGILQQIDLFILHWKALTVICPHISVHFPVDSSRVAQEEVLCSASATFVLASDLSSGCSQVVPSIGLLKWQQERWHLGAWMGQGRSNKGPAPGDFSRPFQGWGVRNRVLHFDFSHVSRRKDLIIDEIVRSWRHKLPFCVLALMEKVLKESQRCYCNMN